MTLDECISVLVDHQKWRRAEPPYEEWPTKVEYKTSPKLLGEAIDFAIKKLKDKQ